MSLVRPNLALLWPSYTLFPLAGFGVLVFGASGRDSTMVIIGLLLLAANAAIVINYAYFTKLRIEDGDLVYRTNFGSRVDRVPLGGLQRIDAKRYPGAHSGVSAPFFVARVLGNVHQSVVRALAIDDRTPKRGIDRNHAIPVRTQGA